MLRPTTFSQSRLWDSWNADDAPSRAACGSSAGRPAARRAPCPNSWRHERMPLRLSGKKRVVRRMSLSPIGSPRTGGRCRRGATTGRPSPTPRASRARTRAGCPRGKSPRRQESSTGSPSPATIATSPARRRSKTHLDLRRLHAAARGRRGAGRTGRRTARGTRRTPGRARAALELRPEDLVVARLARLEPRR